MAAITRGSFIGGPPSPIMREPDVATPILKPSDYKFLLSILDQVIENAEHQRTNPGVIASLGALRARVKGQPGADIPSIGSTIADLFEALTTATTTQPVGVAANKLLDVLGQHGDLRGAETLAKLLNEEIAKLHVEMLRTRQGGQAGAIVEKGHSGVLWVEPSTPPPVLVFDDAMMAEIDALVEDIRAAPRYMECGVPPPTRILFTGPAGVGKTSAARYIAHKLGARLAILQLAKIASKYVGGSQQNISATFAEADNDANVLFFLDEFEAMATSRSKVTIADEGQKISAAMLQEIDNLLEKHPLVVIIGATNVPAMVDDALIDRFTEPLPFGYPSERIRRQMLQLWWAKVPHDVDALERLVVDSEDRGGRWIKGVADRAARAGLRRNGTGVTVQHVAAAVRAAASKPKGEIVVAKPGATGGLILRP